MSPLTDRHNQPKGNEQNPSPRSGLDDLLDEAAWIALRDTALTPQIVTDLRTSEQTRREFVTGCKMLGLTEAHPHQLLAADMLNAGAEVNAILFPRQTGKTETLIAIALGRCAERPKYNAAMTLTTMAAKTSEVFDDRVMQVLEVNYPDEDTRPFKIYRGKGSEHIRWPNGSKFSAKTPKGPAFRGSGYNFVWIDEAGEAEPEQGQNLIGAILPTFDARSEGGQLVLTGTAGKYRAGLLLWDGLQDPDNGMLAYHFPDDLTEDNLAAWEPSPEHPYAKVRELIELTHPGVASGLTTLDTIRRRSAKITDRAQFGREYGGIFGAIGEGTSAVLPASWATAMRSGVPAIPERVSIAACSNWGGGFAAVVAAWRDESGRAYGYVLDHRPGTSWLGVAATERVLKRDVPVVWDNASSDVRREVHVMQRMNPAPRIAERGFKEVTTAAALLIGDINNGNAAHFDQPALNGAAKVAVRRSTGPSSWALGPGKEKDADISTLTAWALALEYFDANPSHEMALPIVA